MTFIPCPGDGAQALVDENFDEHMAMQQDAFLQPGRHEEAKYHGKLRTKFNRMALALHVLQAVCAAWRSTQDATDIAEKEHEDAANEEEAEAEEEEDEEEAEEEAEAEAEEEEEEEKEAEEDEEDNKDKDVTSEQTCGGGG